MTVHAELKHPQFVARVITLDDHVWLEWHDGVVNEWRERFATVALAKLRMAELEYAVDTERLLTPQPLFEELYA